MKRRLLVVLLAALFVVQPVAAASYPTAEAACGQTGSGETLVVVFPGATEDPQVVTERATVYPGTEFRVALCKNRKVKHTRGTEWSLESSPGLNVTDRTDETVTVRVTGAREETDVVAKKKDLPPITLNVRHAATAKVNVTDDPVSIVFENQTAADAYADAERRYLDARESLSVAADRLNESAAALRSGETNTSGTTQTLSDLNESEQAVESSSVALEATLYDTAWASSSRSNALDGLLAVETRERTAETEARNAMQNYLAALETTERKAEFTVFLNLGGAALLGLVVGAVPGWWLTARKLDAVRFDQEVNASVSYGPRLLARAGVLAAVTLVVTLAALFALGGLGKFGGLL